MSGGRPNSDTARRMGVVPFTGDANGSSKNTGSGNYPKINTNKSGSFPGHPAPPEDMKPSANGRNDQQLWSNGSGVSNKGSAPTWPNDQQGAPMNPSNSFGNKQGPPMNSSKGFSNQQPAAAAGPTGGAGGQQYIQQGPQQTSRPSTPQQQQQQQQQQQGAQAQQGNWQGKDVQTGVPVQSNGGSGQWQNGSFGGGNPPAGNQFQQQPNFQGSQQQPQGGFLTGGPKKGSVPKGDYVYYDGNGNQIQPGAGGGPPGAPTGSGHWEGSGSERHFHHHYYYNNQQQQQPQQQQPAPIGYPYDKKMEQKRKRKPGATALAAALVACWACTCCCHAPCGC